MEQERLFKEMMSQAGTIGLWAQKVDAPSYLWAALDAVVHANRVRNAVLIVVSGELSGRVGIFSNRYISGALVDHTGLAGIDAVIALLSVKSGMVGLRTCLASETSQLEQGVAVDIEGLREQHKAPGAGATTPAEVIVSMLAARSQRLHFSESAAGKAASSDNLNEATPASSAHTPPVLPAALPPTASTTSAISRALHKPAAAGRAPLPSGPPAAASGLSAAPSGASPPVLQGRPPGNAGVPSLQPPASTPAQAASRQAPQSDRQPVDTRLESPASRLKPEIPVASVADILEFASLEGAAVDPARRGPAADQERRASARPEGDSREPSVATQTLPVWERPKDTPPAIWRNRKVVTGICIAVAAMLLWLGPYLCAVSECHKQMSQGINFLYANDPLSALHCFVYAAEIEPDYSRAFFYLGIALAEVGDYNQSLDALGHALELGAPKREVLPVRACVLGKMHIYDKSIEDCTSALLESTNIPAATVRSTSQFRSNQFTGAIKDMSDVFDATKSWDMRARLYRERGAEELRLHQFKAAIDDLNRVVDTFPSERIYVMLGDAYRSMNRCQEAIDAYSQALHASLKSYPALLGRGISSLALHRTAEALADFNRAIKIDPQGTEALLQRASLRIAAGQFVAAAEDLQKVVDLNPYNRAAQDKLDMVNRRLHRVAPRPQSTAKLAAAAGVDFGAARTSDPAALLRLGIRHFDDREFDYAVVCFAQIVRLQPGNPTARRYLAYTFEELGDARDAATQLEALNVLHPLDVQDSISLAHCLDASGQSDKAISNLSALLQLQPDCLKAQAALAEIYIKNGAVQKGEDLAADGFKKAKTDADRRLFSSLLPLVPARAGMPKK